LFREEVYTAAQRIRNDLTQRHGSTEKGFTQRHGGTEKGFTQWHSELNE
jgi:hypothetical protein